MPKGKFEIGKAIKLNNGKDVTIVATGHLVWYAVEAARELEKNGISVDLINIHTVKPLDESAILRSVKKTGCCVVAEEHQMLGGLGESVAGLLARKYPAPMSMIAVDDSFGESGKPDQLLKKYGLSPKAIYKAAAKLVSKK